MAITPAWVRLRDTGRDEPQSVLHCKFLQYTTVPRYRIFFFGVWGISVFAIWISPPGESASYPRSWPRGPHARARRGAAQGAGGGWRASRGAAGIPAWPHAHRAASGRDTCFMHGQGPGTSPVPLAAALGARLICGSAPRSSDLSRLWCVTRIIELATCDLASRARTIAVFSELGSTPGRSSGGRP